MKIAECKMTCPDITATVDGVTYKATTSGQFLDHCIVRIPALGLRFTATWDRVLRAYNDGQSIEVDY